MFFYARSARGKKNFYQERYTQRDYDAAIANDNSVLVGIIERRFDLESAIDELKEGANADAPKKLESVMEKLRAQKEVIKNKKNELRKKSQKLGDTEKIIEKLEEEYEKLSDVEDNLAELYKEKKLTEKYNNYFSQEDIEKHIKDASDEKKARLEEELNERRRELEDELNERRGEVDLELEEESRVMREDGGNEVEDYQNILEKIDVEEKKQKKIKMRMEELDALSRDKENLKEGLLSEINSLENDIKNSDSAIAELETDIEELGSEVESIKKISKLEIKIKDLDAKADRLKAQLHAVRIYISMMIA